MTILAAVSNAQARLVGRRPTAVVSSTEEIDVEMTSLVLEAAADIAKGHDWQQLTEFYEVQADGVETVYPFPSDYDRMVQASDIYDPNTWAWGYQHVTDYGAWLRDLSQGYQLTPGGWMIRKNQFHFNPAPSAGNSAIFPYISKNVFVAANGASKATVDRDDDAFALDERLLTLALIWRWKQMKQMDYSEDMRSYEIAVSQEMTRDKGARTIRRNTSHLPAGVTLAWPWPLGGDNA